VAESTAKYATAATLDSIVTERRLFKQADGAGLAVRLVNERIEDWLVARRAHFRVFFRQVIATFVVQTLAITALLTIGGYLVIIERLSLGQLVAAELIVTLALTSLTKFAIKLDDIYDMYAGVYKVDGLLDLPLERQTGEEAPAEGPPVAMSVRDLHFSYLPGRPVFEGLALDVSPGDRVAMVFGSSPGKTTLANVLFGSRLPQSGTITIDGIDFRELTLGTLRHRIAVAEDEEIIRGTVEENVNLGRPEADADTCRQALERVGLLDEIRSLPEGLRTPLTPGGSILSKGQRARLTIARAIAGRPGLLIIDGLLDGLDAATRDRVIEGLADPAWPCTVLFLSVEDWYSARGVRTIRHAGNGNPGAPDTGGSGA
jgi:putative ABC transport system ATP-binding protein